MCGRSLLVLTILEVLIFCAACESPEARRARGGGPGADTGNRDAAVEIHAGARPYYHTRRMQPAL
jgi:hypothetical protein